MTDLLKAVIACAVALVLGLAVGYFWGSSGRDELERKVQRARDMTTGLQTAANEEKERCAVELKRANNSKRLLLTKEHLLRAHAQISANNYGIASQYMVTARAQLRTVAGASADKARERVEAVLLRLEETQAKVMQLDPVARTQLSQLVALVDALPGAR
ncbi:MAG: hypothetical protein H6707_13015 [Deltaproteobacteria bacterium]|nr:hypothetical protein [Deltaproteobacteria bacterium]